MENINLVMGIALFMAILVIVYLGIQRAANNKRITDLKYDLIIQRQWGIKLADLIEEKDVILAQKRDTIEIMEYQLNLLDVEVARMHGRRLAVADER